MVLLAVLCVVPPPATGAALLFPSVEARLEVELECRLSLSLSRAPRCRPPPKRMLRGRSPASLAEDALPPPAEALPPGFGIPLCAGVELSFLVTFPPLGMKLVIFEVLLFEPSVSKAAGAASSLGSSPLSSALSGPETRFPASLTFSFPFSLSLPLTEAFLAVSALLKVRWAMPLRAILGLLAVVEAEPAGGAAPWAVPLLVPFISGRTFPSSSSRGSVLEPVSARSTCAAPGCLAGPAASLCAPPLEPPLLLNSFSFSSMDF